MGIKSMAIQALLYFFAFFFLVRYGKSSMLFGFKTQDGVCLSSTSSFNSMNVAMKDDYPWIKAIGNETMIGFKGDSSDCEVLYSEVCGMNQDHEISFSRPLSTSSIAHLCRHLISKRLRSSPLQVNLLIGGRCSSTGAPQLFWLDEIGSIQEVSYGAHGPDLPLVLSLLDHRMKSLSSTSTSISTSTSSASINTGTNEQQTEGEHREGVKQEVKRLVRECWDTIERRSVGRVGSFHSKWIGRKSIMGIQDL